MKSKIKYFYNLFVDEIVLHEGYSILSSAGHVYILKQVYDFDSNLAEINDYIEIILNKFGEIITEIDGYDYILMKIKSNQKNLFDNFDIRISPIENNSITSKLWIEKVEYLKKQLVNFGKDKRILIQSFNYYCGLAENAISIMIKCEKKNSNKKNFLCHKRMYYPNNTINYYDPTNYIIDYKSRDIAEYLKSCFIKNKILHIEELKKVIKNFRLSPNDMEVLYARMLFPTYYFDLFEQMILSNKSFEEKLVKEVIEKAEEYRLILKILHNEYFDKTQSNFYIEWINK